MSILMFILFGIIVGFLARAIMPGRQSMGLVTKVFPAEEFDRRCDELAKRVATGSPLVFAAIKEGVHAQYYQSPGAAVAVETRWAERMEGTFDMREGIAALMERRKPMFRGE